MHEPSFPSPATPRALPGLSVRARWRKGRVAHEEQNWHFSPPSRIGIIARFHRRARPRAHRRATGARGNVGDILGHSIASDGTAENLPNCFNLVSLGSPSISISNLNLIRITPEGPFSDIFIGDWSIERLLIGTKTVTFGWSYTHADNTVSNGTFGVTVIIQPAGTIKRAPRIIPFRRRPV